VPAGASTGIHEAHELRDKDGKGVKTALQKVNTVIAPVLVGKNILNQKEIDRIMIELDGTPNKDNLGANSMVGVSVACAKVAAKITNQEVYEYLRTLVEILPCSSRRGKPSRKVPYLFMNLLEGGKHAGNGLSFQEYHVVPKVDNVQEAVDLGIKIQNSLKKIIIKDLGQKSIVWGDEGGFAPKTNDIRKPLIYLTEAIRENNLQDKVYFALDVAASSFYENGIYKISGKDVSSLELMKVYESLMAEFNLFSIEDPFDEEDFENFKKLKEDNQGLFVVGDDLTVSNQILLKKAIEKGSINAMIIKPNQIGTLSETLLTMKLARENNIEIIVSHRSGETDDDFVADLAYAFGCFGLKTGSPLKSERMLKYQRLIKISQ
jgi:enolase